MTEDSTTPKNLTASSRSLTWKQHAACIGKQQYFFDDFKATLVREAKKICADCPVREQCLDHAMKFQEYGVWGGLTANERRVMKRRLKRMMRLAK
jgi:WhiB family redox-sensing transcriptional regulator